MTIPPNAKPEADPLIVMLVEVSTQTLAEAQQRQLNTHLAGMVALVQSPRAGMVKVHGQGRSLRKQASTW